MHLRVFVNKNKMDLPSTGFVAVMDRRGLGDFLTLPLLENLASSSPDTLKILVSPIESCRNRFRSIRDLMVFEEYKPTIPEAILIRQRRYGAERKACLILEDCIYDDGGIWDSNIRELVANCHALNVLIVLCMQYPLTLPGPFEMMYISKKTTSVRRRCYDLYAKDVYPNYDAFATALDVNEYLVIKTIAKSSE